MVFISAYLMKVYLLMLSASISTSQWAGILLELLFSPFLIDWPSWNTHTDTHTVLYICNGGV